jgi:hypothetical protein|tara:strand:+ start:609 stop:908 length:300 start_codon:yes stop_codon:yes gene_type:complete
MSSRNLVQPQFPLPPGTYDAAYMAEIVRAFSVFLQQVNNPGDSRATTMTLTNLQSDDYNLETGALFEHEAYIKITVGNVSNPRGSEGTGTVGSATVTTS